jgi:DNA processing protein
MAQLGPLLHGRPAAPDMGRPDLGREASHEPRFNLREVGLREVGPRVAMSGPLAPLGEDDALDLIVEKLSPTPVAVDELVRQCQLSAAAVATLLLELELAGRIERHPGNLVSLR